MFVVSLPAWLLLAKVYGLYSRDEERADHSTADEVFAVFNMLAVGTLGFYAIAYLFPGLAAIPLGKILTFLAFAIPLVVLGRAAARAICRQTDAYTQNTLILGAGVIGQRVARKLLSHPEYGVNVVGFVDEHPRDRDEQLGDLTVLGHTSELPQIVRDYDVERVIVAFWQDPDPFTLGLVRDLNELDVQVDIVPRLFEVIGPETTIHAAEGLPLMGLAPARLGRGALAPETDGGPRSARSSASSSSRRSSPWRRSRSSSTRPGPSSSGRRGSASTTASSRSSSSAPWPPTPTGARTRSRT